ncbi:MAG: hypothetical protein ACWGQW_08625, partial [bacterium]
MGFKVIENTVYLPVVDAKSGKLARKERDRVTSAVRAVRNPAFSWLFPDIPAVILDYGKTREDARKHAGEVQKNSPITVDTVALVNEYLLNRINGVVYYKWEDVEGVIYDSHKEWDGLEFTTALGGSMTKKAMVIGLPPDFAEFAFKWGLFQKAEDIVRGSRLFFCNARFGAAILDVDVRIGFAKKGFQVGPFRIEDGVGVIRRSLAYAIRDEYRIKERKIRLGSAKQNYQVSQRLAWEDIEPEIKPLIEQSMIMNEANVADFRTRVFADQHSIEEWVSLEPLLMGHPMALKAFANETVRVMTEMSSTIPLQGVARVAIPWDCFAAPYTGTWMVIRYPVDSKGNIKALECDDKEAVAAVAEA